jgi:hypothetical protein
MIRKIVSFTSTLVAVFSVVVATQVADAQYFAGSSCCGQSSYSSYSPVASYGYGYAPMSSYGGGSIVGSMGYSYGSCGTPACDTGCYGTTSYRSGCGLFGHGLFRRSNCGYSSCAMGYPSCGSYSGCSSYGGYAVSSGCGYGCAGNGLFGCRHRGRRVASCCLLSNSYTGTTAACCTPLPNISSCMSCGGSYSVQPEYTTSAPVMLNPTPAPASAAKPTTADKPAAPNPAPPEEPKTDSPAPAPEPGN